MVRPAGGHAHAAGGAEAFRWSLASEYGAYAALGTPAAARDQAPDGGGAASFPG